MNPGEWAELSSLLDTALEMPADAREPWLESLTLRDTALKQRLRSLLARSTQIETRDFLGALPRFTLSMSELAALHPHAEKAGDELGAYRLVRELGSGGMSTVWLAERIDGLIDRPVALKLPQGMWRRGALIERFARERQALAALAHPNIARLYDAGVTAGGQPFLALEYVEGEAIDRYCERKNAGLSERLRLFLQVARAVAYAHTRLVVHRDLKPANILVTEQGEVRLLDFGIAKLLDTDAGEHTVAAQLAFTPDYASPEQIAGDTISTSTDVYSLGIVLYELLTGRKPYSLVRGNRAALERAVMSQDPPRPSSVARADARALRGDLDTITLKSLAKFPDERYATVGTFAEDIERYLTNQPVSAQAPSWAYRTRKFVARNRLAVGAGVSLLLVVVAGTGLALWQASVARSAARRAEESRSFLASTIRDADPRQGEGRVLAAADLLRQARHRVDSITQPDMRVEMLTLIASSLLNLEDFGAAESAARESLAEGEKLLGATHEQTLRARMVMVRVHRFRGRVDDMRRELDFVEKSLPLYGEPSAADRYFVIENRGHLAIDAGDADAAVNAGKQALGLAKQAFGDADPRTAAAATLLAEAYEYADVTADFALEAAERAFHMTEAAHGANVRDPRLITARDVYGRALCRAGRMDEGMAQLELALVHGKEVLGVTSATVGFLYENLARYQRQAGKVHAAIGNMTRALEIHGNNVSRDSFTYLSPLSARGIAWLAARRPANALPDLEAAEAGLRKLFGPDHEEVVIAEWNRALALAQLGRHAESRAAFEHPLAAYRDALADPLYLPYRAFAAAAMARRLAGDAAGARALADEAVNSFGDGVQPDRQFIGAYNELGFASLLEKKPDDALDEFRKSAALLTDPTRATNAVQADIFLGMGRAYGALGQSRASRLWLARADSFWREFDSGAMSHQAP